MMPSAKTFVHRHTARQLIILEFCARATRKEDVCGYSEYEREVHSASNQLCSTAVSDQAALPPEDGAPRGTRSEVRYPRRGQLGKASVLRRHGIRGSKVQRS